VTLLGGEVAALQKDLGERRSFISGGASPDDAKREPDEVEDVEGDVEEEEAKRVGGD